VEEIIYNITMKKVFKYGTGHLIPEGAVYLSTVVETDSQVFEDNNFNKVTEVRNVLVWHYFLVKVKD